MLGIIKGSSSFLEMIFQVIALLFAVTTAITVHEWAHAFVAYKNGDLTAKMYGRLTLNPAKHFDLLGFIMLLLAGFGWAKPVPINPNNFKKLKKGIITTSFAGVVMNFIVALIFAMILGLLFLIIKSVGVVDTESFGYFILDFFVSLISYTITINLVLMAFNLLPIYPLDGFHIVEAFTKHTNKYCIFMRKYGMFLLLGIIVLSNLLGMIDYRLDIIGLYLNGISQGVLNLFKLMFNI